jgi:hypothetical protein
MLDGLWWLASYPKSGNTWLRVWLANLKADKPQPADIGALNLGPFAASREWFEDVLGLDSDDLPAKRIQALRPRLHRWAAARATAPLYCKTHDLQARVADDGWLDVSVSLAAHMGCDLDEAILRLNSPGHAIAARPGDPQLRQHLGDWSGHVQSWVDQSPLPVWTVRYEDMLTQPVSTLATIAGFLGLTTEPAALERAVRHARFAELQAQEARHGFIEASHKTARFFRRGEAGAWRDSLSPAQVAAVVERHGGVMARFGYLDAAGQPI